MLVIFISAVSCQNRLVSTSAKANLPSIRKLVVAGFESALPEGSRTDIYRDELTGGMSMAEPVPEIVAYHMTQLLMDRLSETGKYELGTPEQVERVISAFTGSDLNDALRAPEILGRVGRSLQADAVLAGYLYRWREREGTKYGVDRPASVAFSLYLIGSEEGAILWRGQFDRTQKSMTENVFEWNIFYRTGIKWLRVEELAGIGLDQLIQEMPGQVAPEGSGENEL